MRIALQVASTGLALAMSMTTVGCSTDIGGIISSAASSANIALPGILSGGTISEKWTPEAMAQALEAIDSKIGAGPADYVEVTVTPYSFAVEAIDPQRRGNLDRYEFNGSSVTVSPVDVSRNEAGVIEASAFKGDTVQPEILAAVISSAIGDSAVEDGELGSVQLTKGIVLEDTAYIQASVTGPRGSKLVRYNLDGQLQNVM